MNKCDWCENTTKNGECYTAMSPLVEKYEKLIKKWDKKYGQFWYDSKEINEKSTEASPEKRKELDTFFSDIKSEQDAKLAEEKKAAEEAEAAKEEEAAKGEATPSEEAKPEEEEKK